jgi:hypothetical protein
MKLTKKNVWRSFGVLLNVASLMYANVLSFQSLVLLLLMRHSFAEIEEHTVLHGLLAHRLLNLAFLGVFFHSLSLT